MCLTWGAYPPKGYMTCESYRQCDRIARLFVQELAVYNNEHLLNSKEIGLPKFCHFVHRPSKMGKSV